MGMSLNRGGGGRRGRRTMSDINVTPMVDVMLVLLIIFMVTAPLLATGVDVELPNAAAPSLPQADNTTITINVMADGSIVLNNAMDQSERATDLGGLVAQMAAIRQANPEGQIYVRGDQSINYGRVMEVMGALFSAGYKQVALLTDPKAAAKASAPTKTN
ncbi:protein TolR [Caenispirillum bisanense]|uniref:protein TolR n=1 Tax=Caenispirillum bisanense TaxID=414052 RepID=UPI0031DEF15D